MKRPIRTIINDLIQIASELEEFETNLSQFLGTSIYLPDESTVKGEPIKSAPFPDRLFPNRKRNLIPKADLTKTQKEQIRLLHSQGHTIPQLAATYNTNQVQITAILRNNILKAQEATREKARNPS